VPPGELPAYAQVAHVPPQTVDSGTASFVVRGFDPSSWRSSAEGRWLVVNNDGPHRVQEGSVVVITEGRTTVAYFTVKTIDRD